jgi:hypothetical protein
MIRRVGVLAALALFGMPARLMAEGQIRATASLAASLASRWHVTVEVQPRWERDVSEYTQTVVRAEAGYQMPRAIFLWGGVEHHEPSSPTALREDRLWQAVTWTSHAGHWTFGHRARLEERWLALVPSVVLRGRYQLRTARPLGPHSPWGVIGVAELYVTLRGARPGPVQGIDRGRLAAGLSRRVSPRLTVETGYACEYINRPAPVPNHVNNILVANLAVRLPTAPHPAPAD